MQTKFLWTAFRQWAPIHIFQQMVSYGAPSRRFSFVGRVRLHVGYCLWIPGFNVTQYNRKTLLRGFGGIYLSFWLSFTTDNRDMFLLTDFTWRSIDLILPIFFVRTTTVTSCTSQRKQPGRALRNEANALNQNIIGGSNQSNKTS